METDKRAVETQEKVQRFVLLAVEGDAAPIEAEKSLHELEELLETAGAVSVGRIIQKLDSPHPKTYLGTGKIAEVKEKIAETGADGVITDDELTPVQLKALTDQLGVKVVDRTLLILDIFSQRAVTKEGMMQVELAQLNYRLTRLTGLGTELSRQGAAVGTHTRGAGETKLELDRRHIRRRIDMLNRQLKDMEQQRGL
ncbi:MAG: GTPase HflX, partial [Clostridia bacterium]